MLDTIILLSGPAEHATLPALLLGHNPQLTVITLATCAGLATIDPDVLQRARLIASVTPEIVPKSILAGLGYGAFNFHPGPPSYPGWAPAHFALYDQATEFGATLHVMVKRVDAGSIVDVALFAIPADIGVADLQQLAYAHLAEMFWRSAKLLATRAEPLGQLPIRWRGKRNSGRDLRG